MKQRLNTNLALPLYLGVALLLIAGSSSGETSKWELDVENHALYESNIYHSFDDTLETGAFVDRLDMKLDWKIKPSRDIRHRFQVYTSLDIYPSYSDRNQSAFGIVYEPYWKYSRKGKLTLELGLSRRNKDLIDDAGQVLARTLEKWNSDIQLTHDYRIGKVKTELSLRYAKDNYDEVVGSTSYDYTSFGGRARLEYDLTSRLTGRVTLDLDHRDYDERRTYTVQYGAFIGRPFEIRKYTLTDLELSTIYDLGKESNIKFDFNWARRSENFENFYGYDYWQAKLSLDLQPAPKHAVELSFRYKDKQYDNYWNSSIGQLNRVWVEYTDFQIEYRYRLSNAAELIGYTKNYNKQSNYRSADYQNLTTGVALKLKL